MWTFDKANHSAAAMYSNVQKYSSCLYLPCYCLDTTNNRRYTQKVCIIISKQWMVWTRFLVMYFWSVTLAFMWNAPKHKINICEVVFYHLILKVYVLLSIHCIISAYIVKLDITYYFSLVWECINQYPNQQNIYTAFISSKYVETVIDLW